VRHEAGGNPDLGHDADTKRCAEKLNWLLRFLAELEIPQKESSDGNRRSDNEANVGPQNAEEGQSETEGSAKNRANDICLAILFALIAPLIWQGAANIWQMIQTKAPIAVRFLLLLLSLIA